MSKPFIEYIKFLYSNIKFTRHVDKNGDIYTFLQKLLGSICDFRRSKYLKISYYVSKYEVLR